VAKKEGEKMLLNKTIKLYFYEHEDITIITKDVWCDKINDYLSYIVIKFHETGENKYFKIELNQEIKIETKGKYFLYADYFAVENEKANYAEVVSNVKLYYATGEWEGDKNYMISYVNKKNQKKIIEDFCWLISLKEYPFLENLPQDFFKKYELEIGSENLEIIKKKRSDKNV